ncbi:uncharacterized protein LOC126048387 isoform X3 [Accipiter gentilis]|uniref:uncharacterized protein LOC126048387 isoform X3 n=1 Tax=Astur gentilis TaxID=8957 RepID=UPI002110CA85|nr:uncharacterized protein LOC126048387 isoform X3 [Accipiter gentilis]
MPVTLTPSLGVPAQGGLGSQRSKMSPACSSCASGLCSLLFVGQGCQKRGFLPANRQLARQQTEPSQFTRWHSLTVPGACSPLSQREAHFHKARPDGIGLCPGMGRAEDEETSREEAKRDALKKSLLQEDLMTEAKKAFPTRMALQGLRLGSSLPGKGSYLVSSPSTPCPGTCNSENSRPSAPKPSWNGDVTGAVRLMQRNGGKKGKRLQ